MRTILRLPALVPAAVLALGLTACSGSGPGSGPDASPSPSPSPEATGAAGTTTLCEATAKLDELSASLGELDATQLDEARASFEEITSTLESVDPPAEVADSVEVVRTEFRELTDALDRAVENPADQGALSDLSDAMSSLSSQEVADATSEIQQYTEANC